MRVEAWIVEALADVAAGREHHALASLLAAALDHAHAQLAHRDGEHEDELTSVQHKLTETRAAMDRYFQAFEHGTMPEDTCASRIATLGEQTKALKARASELASLADSKPYNASWRPTSTRSANESAPRWTTADPCTSKAILQELTDEIRIDSRDAIEPTFLVPAVRPPSGSIWAKLVCAQTRLWWRRRQSGWSELLGTRAHPRPPQAGAVAERPGSSALA